jgi:hypothetical protein
MTVPDKPFTEALGDLLADYLELDLDVVIEVMEAHLDALYDDANQRSEKDEP